MTQSGRKLKLPRTLVVEVDSNEKRPFLFPKTISVATGPKSRSTYRVTTITKRLQYGDYRLSSHPEAGIVERKSGLNELSQNFLTVDRKRFTSAFSGLLGACHSPLLIVEGTPNTLLKRPKHHKSAKGGEVFDNLSALLVHTNIPLMFTRANTPSAKLESGELCLRFLIQAAIIFDEENT